MYYFHLKNKSSINEIALHCHCPFGSIEIDLFLFKPIIIFERQRPTFLLVAVFISQKKAEQGHFIKTIY